MSPATTPSPSTHSPAPARAILTLALLGFVALIVSACSTAGAQLDSTAPQELSFIPEEEEAEEPVIELEEPDAEESVEVDPAIAGGPFDVAAAGPTLAVAGQEGVWWFDANGVAHLVVEPAVAADYDGAGGLVFQRSASSPVVRRTSEAVENDVVAPGEGEQLRLIGVGEVNGGFEAIYLRIGADSAQLERATLADGITTTIGEMLRDGVAPERMSISGGYVSGVYLEGAGAGWVTVSISSGAKLFGTADGSLGACAEGAPGCAEAVTVSADGTTVYQVAVGEEPGQWHLVLNNAADFSEIARVDLERPADGWHPLRVDEAGGNVFVSRSVNPDGTGDLPALVVEPASGTVTQLEHPGQAVAILG